MKQNTFKKVSAIFRFDENHSPLFMNSQNAPGRLKLNQLAKRAVFTESVPNCAHITRDNVIGRGHTIKLSKLLKTGIAVAMIQATTQRATPIPIQDPTALKSRFCMRSVPAQTRV
jgi:hypothetical protein